eukprot:TRINITY_DN8097_c0_g1_i2.p6 TRINITY_DN8097_c0_g1~~TRINITY_DN8097_c0_g1_i2.p6  ORF type:complete len:123 (-),score=2.52 TRINITY_DN8097_c0_g1_i2:832-1200(-)
MKFQYGILYDVLFKNMQTLFHVHLFQLLFQLVRFFLHIRIAQKKKREQISFFCIWLCYHFGVGALGMQYYQNMRIQSLRCVFNEGLNGGFSTVAKRATQLMLIFDQDIFIVSPLFFAAKARF